MKKTCALLLFIGLILNFTVIHAVAGTKESFYRSSIDQKIKDCETIGRLENSKGEHVRSEAKKAIAEAKFFRQHEEELVRSMVKQNLEPRYDKVDYFLITTYSRSANRHGHLTAKLKAKK